MAAGKDLGAVRVEGYSKFRRDLKQASPEVNKQLTREVKEIAEHVALEAAAIAPRRSGSLAGSYRGIGRATRGIVRNTQFYGRFVEFGFHPRGGDTMVQGVNPIGRALEHQEDRIVDEMGDAVERAAQRVGWH